MGDDAPIGIGAALGKPLLTCAPLDSTPEEIEPLAKPTADEGVSIFLDASKLIFLSVLSRSSVLATAPDALTKEAIAISILC